MSFNISKTMLFSSVAFAALSLVSCSSDEPPTPDVQGRDLYAVADATSASQTSATSGDFVKDV